MADRIGSPPFLSVNATVPVTLPPDNAPAFVKQSHQSKILAAMRAEAEALQKLYTYLSDYVECSVPIGDRKYTVLAKNILPGGTSATSWAITFISETSISISIPQNFFSLSAAGPQPIIQVNGADADYIISTNNVLPVISGRSYILLKCTVNDDPLYAMDTTAVEVINLSEAASAALANTLTERYIYLAGIDSESKQVSQYQTTPIRTIRNGDRKNANSMHFYIYT